MSTTALLKNASLVISSVSKFLFSIPLCLLLIAQNCNSTEEAILIVNQDEASPLLRQDNRQQDEPNLKTIAELSEEIQTHLSEPPVRNTIIDTKPGDIAIDQINRAFEYLKGPDFREEIEAELQSEGVVIDISTTYQAFIIDQGYSQATPLSKFLANFVTLIKRYDEGERMKETLLRATLNTLGRAQQQETYITNLKRALYIGLPSAAFVSGAIGALIVYYYSGR